VSKRHEKRESEKRRSRWKLRKKRDDGYTHHGGYAGAVFVVVFLAIVIGIIEVMGRWANGSGSAGADRALHGQRLPGLEGVPTLSRGALR
jgi:hypothetical protein